MMKLPYLISLLACSVSSLAFGQDHTYRGRVLDRDKSAVSNVSVSVFWSANGSRRNPNGTEYDLSDRSQLKQFWGNVGQMESWPEASILTNENGEFTIKSKGRDRALLAMDAERKRGCILELPDRAEENTILELTLVPVVTVRARFRSDGESKRHQWSHAYVELAPNPTKPLAYDRLISCGSFDGGIEFRLPPGDYQLDAYGISDVESGNEDLRVHPAPKFTIRDSDSILDLGALQLSLASPDRNDLESESKHDGRWYDFKKHYGELAPDWHSVDGRGIDHKKNIAQLRGKWVLLYFWGLNCVPCLGHGIPKIMEFCEKNARLKSQFEIVGVCIDFSGEIETMPKLDSRLAAIETHAWKGKKISFPIVLDNSFKSWERYGIPSLGTVVLVDPEGRLVEGDETTLQAILAKAKQSDAPKSPAGQ